MTVYAEFTIAAAEFTLGQVLARDPNTHVEMERVVPSSGLVMPYVWVHGGDFPAFESAIGSADSVGSLTQLDVVGGSALYRVAWEEHDESLVAGLAETGATVLTARGADVWHFRIRFEDHGGLTAFHNFCKERAISFTLDRVYTLSEVHTGLRRFGLTDPQREALSLAVERGYFEVPRRTTLTEIGERLGVTEQSASESVRRGADAVLKQVVLDSNGDEQ
ncbi:helix-turn-helix domain-containing protein [Halobaculum marinum]|uniref:Helix-turn-helix domain-containing protein n=1 Tax=Halobaculum marinum TaxID=3031996 RepID=A0ABD5WXZ0_9EURY|nr:helix-turn-helix domain-containing protein [Halobaculum sp. DT55]